MSFSSAIEALDKISSDLVVLRKSNEYDAITASYFSALERGLAPACFLSPSSAAQLADTIKALQPFTSILKSKLAICGSGQQSTPGVANVRDGITIYLRNRRGVKIDRERKLVSITTRKNMGNVYEHVTEAGFGVVGNRHSSGGIGGDALHGKEIAPSKISLRILTISGGLSYFSYARGLVYDNVVNYEIVLSSGEIANANSETNKDLWVALKGGENNFGIVTRFELEVFEKGKLWGGKLFYFKPSFPQQVHSLVDYLHDPNSDLNVHICLSLRYAAAFRDIVCMNDIFCTRLEKSEALGPFADI